MTKEEFKQNLKSQYWRLNNLYWIIDKDGIRIKFKMKYVQYIFYKTMWFLNLILKSRQHGITTFVCLLFLDTCLFTPNIRAGIICHKLSAAKNIFRMKVKYAYNNLPETLKKRAEFAKFKDDTQEIVWENGSSFFVTASARSDAIQLLHISEYSWICQHEPQKAKEIKTGALPALARDGLGIIECTSEGVGDDFQHMYEIADAKAQRGDKMTRMDYKRFFFPWFFDTRNQLFEDVDIPPDLIEYFAKVERVMDCKLGTAYRAWYVKTKEALREDMFNQHPSTSEEAFFAAIEGTILGRHMIRAKEDHRIDSVPWDPAYPVYTMWDLGTMHTAIWFVQFIGNRVNWFDFYEDNSGLGAETYSKVLNTKPYTYSGHCTGWDILGPNKKDATGRMVIDLYASLGIHFDVVEKHSPALRIGTARRMIERSWFDDRHCVMGIKHLMNYHYEKDEISSTEEHTVFNREPVHDAASHAADSFGHGCIMIAMCEEEGRLPGSVAKKVPEHYAKDVEGISYDKMRVL